MQANSGPIELDAPPLLALRCGSPGNSKTQWLYRIHLLYTLTQRVTLLHGWTPCPRHSLRDDDKILPAGKEIRSVGPIYQDARQES